MNELRAVLRHGKDLALSLLIFGTAVSGAIGGIQSALGNQHPVLLLAAFVGALALAALLVGHILVSTLLAVKKRSL